MSRTLNSPVGDARGELIFLYEIEHSGGTIRITNAPQDITALGQTFSGIGSALRHGPIQETGDRRAQGVELTLYGVDQTIINAIQANRFRGYPARIYMQHYDPDTGVAQTPDLLIEARQNSDFRSKEVRNHLNPESGGVVEVSTRITADLAELNRVQSVRSSVDSHQEMIRRSGVGSPNDKFFERVPTLANKEILWGTPSSAPETRTKRVSPGYDPSKDV